jgi:hypothetical protein
MCGTDEGNPRKFYVGIRVMIPGPRARQPREEEMKCGTQPADIRMIHRRSHSPHVALLARCHLIQTWYHSPFAKREAHPLPALDETGHIRT